MLNGFLLEFMPTGRGRNGKLRGLAIFSFGNLEAIVISASESLVISMNPAK